MKLPDVTDDPDEAKKPVPTKEQMIRLSLERFTVPEILFNPSDIGEQGGAISCICKTL